MKRSFFASVLILFSISCYSQTVNGILVSEIESDYIQIVGTSKLLSNKVKIDIDFGQKNKVWVKKDTEIRDENNKPISLNSMIDALNFMSRNGYEFVQAYAISNGGQNVYHYLMRKRK